MKEQNRVLMHLILRLIGSLGTLKCIKIKNKSENGVPFSLCHSRDILFE